MTNTEAAPHARRIPVLPPPTGLPPTGWQVLYPRRRGWWTLVGDGRRYARFEPSSRHIAAVEPHRDQDLPALAAHPATPLLSYRIGRRAVFETGEGFVKIVRPRRVSDLVAVHGYVADTRCSFATPVVLAASDDGRIELTRVQGQSLHQLIRVGSVDESVIDSVARAIASLHAKAPVIDLDVPVAGVDEAERWAGVVAMVEPGVGGRLLDLARLLPEVEPSSSALIHGDLHDKNVFVHEPTSEAGVGLIDLDGLALGAPEHDVANLGVHLRLRSLQATGRSRWGDRQARRLYDAYGRQAPLSVDRLRAMERHTWFRLACLYRYRGTSPSLLTELLRRSVGDGYSESYVGAAEIAGGDCQTPAGGLGELRRDVEPETGGPGP